MLKLSLLVLAAVFCYTQATGISIPSYFGRSCSAPRLTGGYCTPASIRPGRRFYCRCRYGLKLSGTYNPKCSLFGLASAAPTCKPAIVVIKSCPIPTKPSKGSVGPIKTIYKLRSSIWFNCNRGYKLVGTKDLKCTSKGPRLAWSAPFPRCVRIQCPDIPDIPNSSIKGKKTNNYPGSKVWFFCNNGFDLIGTKDLTCSATGTWSADFPACEAPTCQVPDAPANGDFTTSNDDYTIGTRLNFSCEEGFNLVGRGVVTCLKGPDGDGEWSHEFPFCEEETLCDNLGELDNGSFEPDQDAYQVGQNVVYQCDEGYGLVGGSVLECQDDGSYNDTMPECIRITCANPRIANGGIRGKRSNNFPEDKVWFSCNTGFQLDGTKDLTCQDDGQWNHDFPTCERIFCKDPKIANGKIRGKKTENEPKDKVWFSCNTGFILNGNKDLTCLGTGKWNNDFPTCQRVFCKDPQIANGKFRGKKTENEPKDKVWFSCNTGFTLNGNKDLTCLGTGKWNNDFPTCQPVFCKDPKIANGKFRGKRTENEPKDKVWFSCNTGFILNGNKDLTCLATGKWNNDFPTCQSGCRDPQISNGYFKGKKTGNQANDKVWFFCNKNHNLNGFKDLTCQANGKWNRDFPTCERGCRNPQISNGYFKGKKTGNQANDKVWFFCNRNFKLSGYKDLTCRSTGQWNRRFPTCIPSKPSGCSSPPRIRYGYVRINSSKTKAWYGCYRGYDLRGAKDIVCVNGIWNRRGGQSCVRNH